MVGTAREEEVATPPLGGAAAAILPRRILFHPPLKAPPPTSSLNLNLTPLNLPSPPLPSSSTAILKDPSHHNASLCPTAPLPTMRIHQIGAGLNNLGNTCFLNAVLQCLTYTPPLAAYFQGVLHQSSCQSVGFCAMCALENHVKQALSARGRVISPNQLVKNLRFISRSFHMGRQEDAHEYMRYLIVALQKSCPLETNTSSFHRNFIQRIFGGRLRSQVKCTQCLHSSNTYDPFLDLSLDIVKVESLQKALTRFTGIEVLDGENKYYCSKCKMKVRAHKQFTINNAPHVLTVQFKRFSSSGGCGGKIDKTVQFNRSLNLTSFVNGGKEGVLRYSLYAVLVHSGWSTHSGHYFCFVRTSTDIWHKLDDNRVSQVSEKSVLEQKAYILFYMRDMEPTSNGNDYGKSPERSSISNGTTSNGKDYGIRPERSSNGNDYGKRPERSSNGKDYGKRPERISMLISTSDVAKAKANGISIYKDTAQLKGNISVGSRNHNGNGNIDDNTVRSKITNTITNDPRNDAPGLSNSIEVLSNGNMAMAPTRHTMKVCNPSHTEVVGKEHAAKIEAGGVFGSSINHVASKDDIVLKGGAAQMTTDLSEPSTRSEEKTCTLASAELKSHRPYGDGGTENSCLTEKKMKRNEIYRHRVSGNGSVKCVCLTNSKEVDVKEDKLLRVERQAAILNSTINMPSSKEKAVREHQTAGQSVSCNVLPHSSFEMAVPQWEDAEEIKGNVLKEQNFMAETVAHCGHVLDKWDEEYDRGKRKKIRSKKGVQQGITAVSECLHMHKKRKKVCSSPEPSGTVPAISEDCHSNVFQAFAGKKAQSMLHTARLKKSKKRLRGLGHKLFLKRYRFKQLHANRQRRRKGPRIS